MSGHEFGNKPAKRPSGGTNTESSCRQIKAQCRKKDNESVLYLTEEEVV